MNYAGLKKKMLDKGRDDFVNYLAEILGITAPSASRKLKGEIPFTLSDVGLLDKELHFTNDEIREIFLT